MVKSRSNFLFCLIFLFALVQGMVLVHGVEHGFQSDHEEPACHLCIAGHGLGTLISGPTFTFTHALVALALALALILATPALSPVAPRQRGPPLFS